LSGIGLCVGLITCPEDSNDCGVSNECYRETPSGEDMTRNRFEAPLEIDLSELCLNEVVPLSSATFIILRKEIKKAIKKVSRICSNLPGN